jgi:hypothetical protein
MPDRQFQLRLSAGFVAVLAMAFTNTRIAVAQCGPQWLPGDGLPGVSGTVHASIMWDPDGGGALPPRLVVGGDMEIAGRTLVTDVAVWEGSSWSSLGFSTTQQFAEIEALAVLPNGELVAAGSFTTTGGTPATNIARWNGSAWLPLGSGINGLVYSLAVMPNGDLVAGGTFNNAGGGFASNIARWNGTTWSQLGAGIVSGLPQPARVHTLIVLPNGNLVAGGHFTIAGGNPANFIARWDGTSWFPLGSGMSVGNPSDVYALAVLPNGHLIAGGGFSNAGGTDVNRIARWDGSNWFALGSGISIGGAAFSGTIRALAVRSNGDLLVGGDFDTAGGAPANNVAVWNGSNWSPLAQGIPASNSVRTLLQQPDGVLVTGGNFSVAGTNPVANIARWDGSAWQRFGSGLTHEVAAWAMFDDGKGAALYAGGQNIAPGGIGKWDGIEWTSLGSGTDGFIEALAVFDDGNGPALYAGGQFSTAGGLPVNHIAKWNGGAWSQVGSLGAGGIYALAVFDDGNGPALYAGGALAVNSTSYNIARWDGSTWSDVDGGINAPVYDMAVYQGPSPRLYAGGFFGSAGGIPAYDVAGWDGFNWYALGPGTSTYPELATASNGDLLAAPGALPGGAAISRWNGSTWSSFPSVPNSTPDTILVMPNDDVIAGGTFTQAGGVVVNNIARWNGAAWSALGPGLDNHVSSLYTLPNDDLVASGAFTSVAGNPSAYWARWTEIPTPWIARQPQMQTIAINATATLSSAPANGYSGVSYQWQRNGADIADGPSGASAGGGTVSGASGTLTSPTYASFATLTIDDAQTSDSGDYTVVFTNACGAATSDPAALLICGCGLADVNCDDAVDLSDLATLLSNFGRQDNPPRSAGNLDGDSDVDLADLTALLSSFGVPCD